MVGMPRTRENSGRPGCLGRFMWTCQFKAQNVRETGGTCPWGQTGHVHGTASRQNSLCLLVFGLFPVTSRPLISLQKRSRFISLQLRDHPFCQRAFCIFISLSLHDPQNGGNFRQAPPPTLRSYAPNTKYKAPPNPKIHLEIQPKSPSKIKNQERVPKQNQNHSISYTFSSVKMTFPTPRKVTCEGPKNGSKVTFWAISRPKKSLLSLF